MVAIVSPAEIDPLSAILRPPEPSEFRCARDLACAYDAHVAACWRGEGDGYGFLTCLAGVRPYVSGDLYCRAVPGRGHALHAARRESHDPP